MAGSARVVKRCFLKADALQGEKVLLRPYTAGFSQDEIARLYRWSRDKEVVRWSGGRPLQMELQEFAIALRDSSRWLDPSAMYFLIFTRTGELIGRIGYYDVDHQRREAQLGIVIGEKAYWGLGYGRDAINTLLHHIFTATDLERIYLLTYTNNLRAQRCFLSCGFRPARTHGQRFLPRGTPEKLEMEITRQEWQQQHPQRRGANPEHRTMCG